MKLRKENHEIQRKKVGKWKKKLKNKKEIGASLFITVKLHK
jgi:hypothetical protein